MSDIVTFQSTNYIANLVMANKNDSKKNHHYVYARYLKPWLNTDNEVYYLSEKKNSIASASVKAILKEAHFYRAENFNKLQLDIIQKIIEHSNDHLYYKHIELLSKFIEIQNMEINYIEDNSYSEEKISYISRLRSNTLEDLHCGYELAGLPALDMLSKGNLTFLHEEQMAKNFFIFLGHQIARTKNFRMFDELIDLIGESKNANEISKAFKSCWWFLTLIIGQNLAYFLCESYKKMNTSLLLNKTSLPFITSDQPVISLNENKKLEHNLNPKYLDIYYPVSPRYAFVISERKLFNSGIVSINKKKVDELNTRLSLKSRSTIVSNDPKLINVYKSNVGTKNSSFLKFAKDVL